MAFTLTQLQAIEDAIAAGELTVEYDGKRVTYRAMHELVQARDMIRASLVASGQLAAEPRLSYVEFDKG